MDKKDNTRAYAAGWIWAILSFIIVVIIPIGSCIIDAYAVRRSTIDNRYNVSSLGGESPELKIEFKDGSRQHDQITIEPAKGVVKYGMNQTEGPKNTKYKVLYRKTTSSNWLEASTRTISKNNTWTNDYNVVKCNGTTDYIVRVSRVNNQKKKSILLFDLFLD